MKRLLNYRGSTGRLGLLGFFFFGRYLQLRAGSHGVNFEIFSEPKSKLVDLFLESIDDLLDGVLFEGIV